ncbi:unnamed protein product, partial [Prorocentrum cordatum]
TGSPRGAGGGGRPAARGAAAGGGRRLRPRGGARHARREGGAGRLPDALPRPAPRLRAAGAAAGRRPGCCALRLPPAPGGPGRLHGAAGVLHHYTASRRSAAKRQPAPALVRSHQVAPAASTEEDQLAAFRERYPVDGTAFDLLAKQPVDVKSMVISKFYPPNVMSDYSTMLTKCVQAITKASRGSLQVATFSTGCFWKSQQLFDAVSGVVNTTVGYTGGNTKREPTHESVQLGDGHSEAIRVEFDPELITYDALLIHFDRIRRLTPAPVGLASAGRAIYHTTARESGTTTQHHSAVWYHNEKQAEVLREHCKQTDPDFHVARMTRWHDAEDYHQKFYQKGCSVQ